MNQVELKLVPASATWPLRHRVLRPNQPPESSRYAEDELPGARHYAACRDGLVLAVASLYPQAEPGLTEEDVWRLRGMASAPEVRGQGFGGQVLAYLLSDLKTRGARRLWCNARVTVTGFYERYSFKITSDPFDLPGIGPHVVMKHIF